MTNYVDKSNLYYTVIGVLAVILGIRQIMIQGDLISIFLAFGAGVLAIGIAIGITVSKTKEPGNDEE